MLARRYFVQRWDPNGANGAPCGHGNRHARGTPARATLAADDVSQPCRALCPARGLSFRDEKIVGDRELPDLGMQVARPLSASTTGVLLIRPFSNTPDALSRSALAIVPEPLAKTARSMSGSASGGTSDRAANSSTVCSAFKDPNATFASNAAACRFLFALSSVFFQRTGKISDRGFRQCPISGEHLSAGNEDSVLKTEGRREQDKCRIMLWGTASTRDPRSPRRAVVVVGARRSPAWHAHVPRGTGVSSTARRTVRGNRAYHLSSAIAARCWPMRRCLLGACEVPRVLAGSRRRAEGRRPPPAPAPFGS